MHQLGSSKQFELATEGYVSLEDVLNTVFARESDRSPGDYEVKEKTRKYPKIKKTEEQLVAKLTHGTY